MSAPQTVVTEHWLSTDTVQGQHCLSEADKRVQEMRSLAANPVCHKQEDHSTTPKNLAARVVAHR